MAFPAPKPIGPGTLLQDRYEVQALLQEEPGTSTYRGLDLRMGREVRIRVFPLPAPTEVEAYAQFDQRTLVLAPLHHPHIQAFFDAGMLRREGFTVMEWLEGETLAERIARTGPLPWPEARNVLRELLSALAYAHAHGVAHLRLTAETVFLAQGEGVKLRDFAHGAGDAAPGPGDTAQDLAMLASLAVAMIRPGALPQEVVEGLERLRSEHPDSADVRGLLHILAQGDPPAPRRSRLSIWQRWTLGGAAAGLLAAGLLLRRPPPPVPTLAILPIDAPEAREEDMPLRVQIPEHLRQTLLRWKGLRLVVPDAEAPRPDFEVAGRLDHLQGGTLLTLKLRRTRDGQELWRRTLPFSSQGMTAIQADLRSQLGKALGVPIPERASGPEGHTTMPAFHALMRGRHFLAPRDAENFAKAEAAIAEAITLDPNYANAYAAQAECYALMGVHSLLTPDETITKVRASATKALALDPGEAEARCSLAYVRFRFAWDWTGAEREFRQALGEDPDSPLIHHWYGFFLSCLGRWDEAVLTLKTAVDLDPLGAQAATNLGVAYVWSGQLDRGVAEFRKVMDLDPRFGSVRDRLIVSLETGGRVEEALAERMAWALIQPKARADAEALQQAYAAGGVRGYWEYLERRASQPEIRSREPLALAYAAAALGHDDLAFEAMNRAVDARYPMCVWIPRDPGFSRLQPDPRFQALLQRMNFPEK